MKWRKKAIVLCAALLAAGCMQVPAGAEEASGEAVQAPRYDINLGAKMLRSTAAWSPSDGMKLYFGTFEGSPVAYRILPDSPDTQTAAEASLLLDADTTLAALPINAELRTDADSNIWSESDLCAYLMRRYDESMSGADGAMFSADEAGAIAQTTLAQTGAYNTGYGTFVDYASEGYLFPLSSWEAQTLYADNDARIKLGASNCWWTRSANPAQQAFAGYVMAAEMPGVPHGIIVLGNVNTGLIGLSPALNLKLSSVLLSSTTGRDKTLALVDGAVSTSDGSEWKLTLLDPDKSVKITDGTCAEIQADGRIKVPYTYSDTDSQHKVTQISVMVTDRDYTADGAQILYYGVLQNIMNENGEASSVSNAQSGTGILSLPKNLPEGYKLYLVAECVSDSQHSDYASEPAEIRIHAWSDWSIVKAATTQETGLMQRTCSLCGQTQQQEIVRLYTYSFVGGMDGTYVRGKDGRYRVQIDADIAKYVNVEIDGEVVDRSAYGLKSGSTILSFKKKFMNTLAVGEHTLTANFNDGVASGTFLVEKLEKEPIEVKPAEEINEKLTEKPQVVETETEKSPDAPAANETAPRTGDETALALWICLMCVSGITAMLLVRRRRKESE